MEVLKFEKQQLDKQVPLHVLLCVFLTIGFGYNSAIRFLIEGT